MLRLYTARSQASYSEGVRWLRSGALLAAIVLVPLAMMGFLQQFARSMIYPGSPVPFPSAAELARRYPGARLVEVRSTDGIVLQGALVPAADPAAPVAVYFHGNAESAAQNLPFAAEMARRGLGMFLAEYRGYGGLPGSPTEDGLYADGEAAVDAVLAAGVPAERIVLVGRSLGSGIATEMALRRRSALLVLISPYTSMVEMGKQIAGPAANLMVPDRYDNLSKLARVAAPVVILHGTRDDVVPVAMGRALAAAVPPAVFVEIPSASHNDFPGLEELVEREIGKILRAGPKQ
jgi:fermentation-respiration switch protein FrsA (DUF1100 family)